MNKRSIKLYKNAIEELRSNTILRGSLVSIPAKNENIPQTVPANVTGKRNDLKKPINQILEEQDQRTITPGLRELPPDLIGTSPNHEGQMSATSIINRGNKKLFVKKFIDTHLQGSNGERELNNDLAARKISHFFGLNLPLLNILREYEDKDDRSKNYKIGYTSAIPGAKPYGSNKNIDYASRVESDYNQGKLNHSAIETAKAIRQKEMSKFDPRRLIQIALFHNFINAGDKHEFNYLTDDKNQLHPIDYSYSFSPQTNWEEAIFHKPDPVVRDFVKNPANHSLPIPKEILKGILDNRPEITRIIKEHVLPHYSREKRNEIRDDILREIMFIKKLYDHPNPTVGHLMHGVD